MEAGEGATAAGALEVFTTRPDTLHGTTYMVIAPEHPLLPALVTPDHAAAVNAYVAAAARKSDLERTELQKTKSGLFLGSHAVNPATGGHLPVYVADYVLGSYGSGAIMAVPGHDQRDFEFAQEYELPIVQVRACSCLPTAPLRPGHGASVTSVLRQPLAGGDVCARVYMGLRCAVGGRGSRGDTSACVMRWGVHMAVCEAVPG